MKLVKNQVRTLLIEEKEGKTATEGSGRFDSPLRDRLPYGLHLGLPFESLFLSSSELQVC